LAGFRRHSSGVIAGLDVPAIHRFAKKMDPKVKPAGNESPTASTYAVSNKNPTEEIQCFPAP
jgi:hypothetical protein